MGFVKQLRGQGLGPLDILPNIALIKDYRTKAKELIGRLTVTEITAQGVEPGEKITVIITPEMSRARKQAIKEAEEFIDQFIEKQGLK